MCIKPFMYNLLYPFPSSILFVTGRSPLYLRRFLSTGDREARTNEWPVLLKWDGWESPSPEGWVFPRKRPSKGSCVVGLVPRWWYRWEITGQWEHQHQHQHHSWVNPLFSSHWLGIKGCGWDRGRARSLKYTLGSHPLPLSLSASWMPSGKQHSSTKPYRQAPDLTTMEPASHGLKTSETVRHNKCSLHEVVFLRNFVPREKRKWLTIMFNQRWKG